jgi:hypothetical protein
VSVIGQDRFWNEVAYYRPDGHFKKENGPQGATPPLTEKVA